jgi:hypothetical protein
MENRIYKNFPFSKLLRLKSFFIFCKFPFLVKKLSKLYNFGSRIVGQKNINKFINWTYGDIFIGGENAKELEKALWIQNQDGLISIADYAREFLTKQEEIYVITSL